MAQHHHVFRPDLNVRAMERQPSKAGCATNVAAEFVLPTSRDEPGNGPFIGVEALIRWIIRAGLVPPCNYPGSDECGFIGRSPVVLREACHQAELATQAPAGAHAVTCPGGVARQRF